jgi:hypothetical protein
MRVHFSIFTFLALILTIVCSAQVGDVRARGREIVKLCAAGNAAAVLAQSTPEMVKALPGTKPKDVLTSVTGQAPIGKRISEAITGPQYAAVHAFGGREIVITVTFDGAGKVAGLFISPRLGGGGVPPDPKAGYKTRAKLRLPFDGKWWVFWGGDDLQHNYHLVAPDQRHAYDIVVKENDATHKGDGKSNTDYYAFGRPLVAPADGTVIEVDNSVPDNKPGVMNTSQIYGSHVVLDLGNGEFAAMCHFKQGSITIKKGDRVKSGQQIGLCGNSGNSSEPHIHIHLQDRAKLGGSAIGLPAPFSNYLADGKPVKLGTPIRGQFVEQSR